MTPSQTATVVVALIVVGSVVVLAFIYVVAAVVDAINPSSDARAFALLALIGGLPFLGAFWAIVYFAEAASRVTP